MAILPRIVARLSHDSQDATRAACLLWFFMLRRICVGGGIRTPETLAGLTVFKTAAFNRSATPPRRLFYTLTDSYKTKPRPPVAYWLHRRPEREEEREWAAFAESQVVEE